MLKRYKEDDFSVIDQAELLGAIESIFGVMNTVLVAIAAVSLIVGGIGIMNIMYVTVTERIKEIGIRRALGARTSDILLQFLVESVALSILGGLMGLGLAYGIVLLIQNIFPAYIDLNSVILALGVSSIIGVVFGVFPAKKRRIFHLLTRLGMSNRINEFCNFFFEDFFGVFFRFFTSVFSHLYIFFRR